MKQRILHIIPTLDRGGAEKQLVLLAQGMKQQGMDVHVCVLTRDGPYSAELRQAEVPVTVIGKRVKFDPVALWRLTKHVKTLRPDLVQTLLFAGNSYGRWAAWQAGVPHIVGNERCVDSWKRWHEFAIDRWLAKRSQKIVVNSPGVLDFYERYGIPREKLCLIPNAVEPAMASTKTRHELLAQLGVPAHAHLLGCVARLWPQKEIKVLMIAAEILRSADYEVHLVVMGDGPLRAKLEKFSQQLEMEERIHFLGARNDVADWLPHFSALCLSSRYEGQPNCILEAMSAGIPVVASDIPGVRDMVVDGQTGFLAPVGDQVAFAKAIKKLLDDESLRHSMGQAAQEKVIHEFTVEKMVNRYVELYSELCPS